MRKLFIAMIMLLTITSMTFAEDIDISASVDSTEIEFGDTIQLTISIKKPTSNQSMNRSFNNGAISFSFNSSNFGVIDNIDFDIENIPNFDIIGRSQSSQTSMVNGVGQSVKQINLSLVPQKIGTLLIPAFSMKDKDGTEHSSKPITINVKKVADDPQDEDDEDDEAVTPNGSKEEKAASEVKTANKKTEKKDDEAFTNLLIAGVVIILIIVIAIAFRNYLISKPKDMPSENTNAEERKVKEEQIKKEEVEEVNFSSIVASLKVQYKEIDNEFYRKYFDYFKKACCYRNKALTQDMTVDEIIKKCSKLAGTDNIKQATSRLTFDIEMVMYANTMPNRQLISIETDIKEVLNSL